MKKIKEFLKSDESWLFIPFIGINVLFLIVIILAIENVCN